MSEVKITKINDRPIEIDVTHHDWKKLFEAKQNDWLDACKEIDQLRSVCEGLMGALKVYTTIHDAGCSFAFEAHCDCKHPELAAEALSHARKIIGETK